MEKRAKVTVFDGRTKRVRSGEFDIALYHLGNNPYHDFVYETALQHPGVVVMHEANLHHLIARSTIRRGDWDGYLAECEYNGGRRRSSSPSACGGWKWGRITRASR